MSTAQTLGPTQLETLAALKASHQTTSDIANFVQQTSHKRLATGGLRRTLLDLCKKGYVTSETVKGKRAKQYKITDLGIQTCQIQLSELNKIYVAAFGEKRAELISDISLGDNILSESSESSETIQILEISQEEFDDVLGTDSTQFQAPSYEDLLKADKECAVENIVTFHNKYSAIRYTCCGIAAIKLISKPEDWYSKLRAKLNREPASIDEQYFYLEAQTGQWIQVTETGKEKRSYEFDFLTKQLLRLAVIS